MKKLMLEAPWHTFEKKLKALFELDPDIKVGEIVELEDGKNDFQLDIEVSNHEKFLAMDRVFPKVKTFGDVTLGITIYDEENADMTESRLDLYRIIFDSNPMVKDILEAVDHTGTHHGFVRFQPMVVQFFDDDISDYKGNWSGLAQDIAREVFEDEVFGIHFCTAPHGEN